MNNKRISKTALALCAIITGTASAQNAFWWGEGANNLWNDTANWSDDAAVYNPYLPVAGDNLRWHSNSQDHFTNENDFTGLSVGNISFQSAPGPVILNGNKLTVTGVIGGSGSVGTINLPFEINGTAVTIGNNDNDVLMINSTITETGGSRPLRFSAGNVTLTASNSFSGDVQLGYVGSGISQATVNINTLADSGSNQALGSGSLVLFGFRATDGSVKYTGGTTSTNKGFAIGENAVGSGRTGGGSFVNDGTGAVTWTGTQTLRNQNAADNRTFTLGGSNTDDNTWQSAIQNNNEGTVSVTKEDAGKWILSGTNTYTGATTVSEGTLLINGSTAAGSAVSVASGAVIGGSGAVNGDLTLADGALFAFDPNSTLTLDGTLSLDAGFGVNSLRNTSGGAFDWSAIANDTYTLMNTGFAFSNSNISNFGAANAQSIGDGRSAYFENGSLQLVVIPEPGTLALVGLAGVALLVGLRRRK